MVALIKINEDYIPLINCKISCYQHNIYIVSENINDIFNILFKYKYNNVNDEIQILTEKILYINKNCILQDIKLLKSKIHLNIISEEIIKYDDSLDYIRNLKIKKIINNINEKDL